MKRLLRADWLAPIDRPMQRDAAVVTQDGLIRALGPAAVLRREHPDAVVEDLGAAIVLPGLVNTHTHLELSDCRAGDRPHSFTDWLRRILSRQQIDPARLPELIAAAVRTGVSRSLHFGVTCVGDISKQCALTRPVLAKLPIRAVSYGEVQAMAQRRVLLESRLADARDAAHATPRLTIGLSPHAPYSIEPDGYRRCLNAARRHGQPLATHLAETLHEAPFLADHSGPFRDLWTFIGAWDDHVPRFRGSPIRFAESLGLLDYPTLLAHVNYIDNEDLAVLARGQASVVYCPRTHAYFGHPPHRWRDMLDAGINVAVGTDSCASSPDLNVVDELRLLHRIAPDVPSEVLWEMATLRAARAIQRDESIGSLTVGKAADLVAFPAEGEDPLRAILESNALPGRVWIAGEGVVHAPNSGG